MGCCYGCASYCCLPNGYDDSLFLYFIVKAGELQMHSLNLQKFFANTNIQYS